MYYKCYCGKGFKLSQKEAKLILFDQELFCSPSCFKKFLNEYEPQTKKVPVSSSKNNVSQAMECWDKVTKQGYRSNFEIYVARFFHYEGIKADYEKFSVQTYKGPYTPDFYLPNLKLFIEVKGLWRHGSKQKFKEARNYIDLLLLPAYLQKHFQKEYKEK